MSRDKLKILFLINPISGVGKKAIIPKLIEKHLNLSKFEPSIEYTQYRGHGKEIAQQNLKNYDCIVAIGGDGTVNEIGSALVHSDTAMAIIPTGSGNGLARHLKIPLKIKNALETINVFNVQKIDTGLVNDLSFIGTCGFGFDAYIAHKFDEYHKRGFLSYAKIVQKEFKSYTPLTYTIKQNDNFTTEKAFMFSIANSSQFGNGFTISPHSKIDDGMFEIVNLDKFKYINTLKLGTQFFSNSIDKSKFYKGSSFSHNINIKIEGQEKTLYHLDGEPLKGPNSFNIKILKHSLKVVC